MARPSRPDASRRPTPAAAGDGERSALVGLGEVLASIAGSTLGLEPTLARIAAEARRLTHADGAFTFIRDGELLRPSGSDGVPRDFWEWLQEHPLRIGPGTVVGRSVATGAPAQIADVRADAGYTQSETVSLGHYLTVAAVPIRAEGSVIGGFALGRHTVDEFTEQEIQLASLLADQAAIAIRIATLLSDGQAAQDRELSLAAVLATIARGTFDLHEVLHSIVDEAARLCGAETANLAVRDGEVFKIRATAGFSPEYQAAITERPYTADRGSVIGRTLTERGVVQINDVLEDPEYAMLDLQRVGGYRSTFGVPIWHGGEIIGVIAAGRQEVRPFSDR